ncbi:Uncharacterised protein [Mycobacterium tuberculosis]|nr:Uncharacterised protein [Mycobacterium tuberculosis]
MCAYQNINKPFLTYLSDHIQFIQDYWIHKRFVQNSSKKKKFNFKK